MSVTLTVSLKREAYTAGEVVRGEVVADVAVAERCSGLRVALSWWTHGGGDAHHEDAAELVAFDGEWAKGVHRYPFELELPADATPSYAGHLLRGDWIVRAEAKLPWEQVTAQQELIVAAGEVAPRVEPPPARDEAAEESLPWWLGAGFFTMFIGLCALVIRQTGELGLAAALAVLSGVTAITCAVVATRRVQLRRRLGPVELETTPWPLRPGDAFTHTIRFTPPRDLEADAITVTLIGLETMRRGQGTTSETLRHVLHEHTATLAAHTTFPAGQPVTLDAALALPADAPPTFASGYNRLEWRVQTHLELLACPDWAEERLLPVLPA